MFRNIMALAALLASSTLAAAPTTTLAQDAKTFGNRESARLANVSPSGKPAGNIQVPVLFHGDLDINVDIGHSEKMNSALKKAGKTVTFTRYPDLDHSLDDSNARADMLVKIGTTLEAAIGN